MRIINSRGEALFINRRYVMFATVTYVDSAYDDRRAVLIQFCDERSLQTGAMTLVDAVSLAEQLTEGPTA